MTTTPVNIPPYLSFMGKKFRFMCNKGNTLCYTYTPNFYNGDNGVTIIVEHRKHRRKINQFYVLYYITATSLFDNAICDPLNLSGVNRMAKPEYE